MQPGVIATVALRSPRRCLFERVLLDIAIVARLIVGRQKILWPKNASAEHDVGQQSALVPGDVGESKSQYECAQNPFDAVRGGTHFGSISRFVAGSRDTPVAIGLQSTINDHRSTRRSGKNPWGSPSRSDPLTTSAIIAATLRFSARGLACVASDETIALPRTGGYGRFRRE